VFRLLLTAVHGAATLRLCDRLAPGEDADALARGAIEVTLSGLQAGAGLRISLPVCPFDSVIEDKPS